MPQTLNYSCTVLWNYERSKVSGPCLSVKWMTLQVQVILEGTVYELLKIQFSKSSRGILDCVTMEYVAL